jgi:hypothetical protein
MVERRSHDANCSDPRRSATQWFVDALLPHRTTAIRGFELAYGLASLVAKALSRVREKCENAASSPWFALLCASVSFAVLLLLTGVLTGMALTKQPGRTNMLVEPRIGGITSRGKSESFERNYDNDMIGVLIELTSRQEVESEHSVPSVAPLGLPRILLDARSFATVPLDERRTHGYFE